MNRRNTVRVSSTFHLLCPTGDEQVPGPRTRATSVPVVLRYDAVDPFAVHLCFQTGPSRDVRWVFARTLLADGLLARAGDGDVRVWPGTPTIEDALLVELESPSGHARFEVSATVVAEFLDATYELVPSGRESGRVDLDRALTALLATDEH